MWKYISGLFKDLIALPFLLAYMVITAPIALFTKTIGKSFLFNLTFFPGLLIPRLSKWLATNLYGINLLWATKNRKQSMVEKILQEGVSANSEDGNKAFLQAVDRGYLDIAQFLIENGADVNAKNEYGYTALIWAVEKQNLEGVKFLIDNGANPFIRLPSNLVTFVPIPESMKGKGAYEIALIVVSEQYGDGDDVWSYRSKANVRRARGIA